MERHGWVTPLPGGVVARCGGPAICEDCQSEEAEQAARAGIERLRHPLLEVGFDGVNTTVREVKALPERV